MIYLFMNNLKETHQADSSDQGLSFLGLYNAYLNGIHLFKSLGKDQELVVLSSPSFKNLQTAEIMVRARSVDRKLHKQKILVEDGLRERQRRKSKDEGLRVVKCQSKEPVVCFDIEYNSLAEMRKYHGGNGFVEESGGTEERFQYMFSGLKEFAAQHREKMIVVIAHKWILKEF